MNAILKPIPTITLSDLVNDWVDTKHAEDEIAGRRIALEAQIIAMVGERDEGAETHDLPDGRKLVVTAKLTRTLDPAKYRAVMARIPEQLRPVTFEEVPKLDTKGVRWLRENRADLYALLATALDVKKAKTAISVEAA